MTPEMMSYVHDRMAHHDRMTYFFSVLGFMMETVNETNSTVLLKATSLSLRPADAVLLI